jgi:hypothetical protein
MDAAGRERLRIRAGDMGWTSWTLRLGLLVCGFATSSCDVTVRGHITRLRRSTLSFAFAPSIRTEARDDEESWEA